MHDPPQKPKDITNKKRDFKRTTWWSIACISQIPPGLLELSWMFSNFQGYLNKSHRIHGAAIYGNMDPINIPPMLPYISIHGSYGNSSRLCAVESGGLRSVAAPVAGRRLRRPSSRTRPTRRPAELGGHGPSAATDAAQRPVKARQTWGQLGIAGDLRSDLECQNMSKHNDLKWVQCKRLGFEVAKYDDYIWAIVKTLGSRKGHPQIWEGPIAYHTFVQ